MTWARADRLIVCGGPCHGMIAAGAPMLVIRITQISQPRVRCERCARGMDQTPPGDLPALAPRPVMQPIVKLPTGVGTLAFDYKMLRTREPGEDD